MTKYEDITDIEQLLFNFQCSYVIDGLLVLGDSEHRNHLIFQENMTQLTKRGIILCG